MVDPRPYCRLAKILCILAFSTITSITFSAAIEKTDIVFVLRGQNETTLYPIKNSFPPEAASVLAGLSKISFGKVSSVEIFDGVIDSNETGYKASREDIDPASTTHDVVVVGAGSAGLYAAKTLNEYGYDVMIIEATNRIGGRIKSESLGDMRVELGAEEH